jgi:hypothetical protein
LAVYLGIPPLLYTLISNMTLSPNINNREFDKFREDPSGGTRVATFNFIDDFPLKKQQISGPFITYVGETYDINALDSEPKWRIKQIASSATETITRYAVSETDFTSIWDNRNSIFPPVNFDSINEFSLFFDGANDYVSVPHHSSIDFDRLNPFSISFWVKTVTPSNSTIAEKRTGSVGWSLTIDSSGRVQIEMISGGTGNRIRVREDNLLVFDGSWHHVAVTYDGSSLANGTLIYIDSQIILNNILNDTLTTSFANTTQLTFGANSSGGTPRFSGFLDEIAFYNSNLTLAQVQAIYNAGIPNDLTSLSTSGNLISWWRMGDGDTFPTIQDNEGSNDGTMTNMLAGSIVREIPL